MSSTATLPKVAVQAAKGAVLIRKALKKAFPGTTFSVKLSAGGTIRVGYKVEGLSTWDIPLHAVMGVSEMYGSERFDVKAGREIQQYREVQTKEGRVLHTIHAMVYVEQEA